jgi:hypothetical protein
VCWTQIGYACGYTSAFMGRTILYKEVECTGMGHNNCRIVGKPAEEWDDAAEQMRYFNGESIADQLIDLQTQVVQLRSSIGDRDQMPEDVTGDFTRIPRCLRPAQAGGRQPHQRPVAAAKPESARKSSPAACTK